MRVQVPPGFRVDFTDRARAQMVNPSKPIQLAFYSVEFGNLESFHPAQEEELLAHLRRRVGQQGQVSLGRIKLGGRNARRVRLSGLRQSAPWGMGACWCLRGGQAFVVEVLYPASSLAEGEQILDRLVENLRWIEPDRG